MSMTDLTTPDLMPDGRPRPNLPLLRKVLDHIDAHPETWDQTNWGAGVIADNDCGTTMCVSGWAQVLSGAETVGFANEGQEVLGLTHDEANDLFVNTLDGRDLTVIADCPELPRRDCVQRVAEAIAARAGERL